MTKTPEELAKENEVLMLTMSDISGTLYERKIANFIEKQAEEIRVGRQLVNINRDLVNSDGVEILVPKRVALNATMVSEGVTITLDSPSYDSVAIAPQIYGEAIEIGEESLAAAKFDLIADQLENIALALAQREDVDIIRELIAYTALSAAEDIGTGAGGTTFAFSYDDVIEIVEVIADSVTLTTSYTIDYKDGAIIFSTAPSAGAALSVDYIYNASTTCVDVFTAGVLSLEAVISARNSVIASKFKPDTLVINHNQEADLIQDERFLDKSKSGMDVFQSGFIGRVVGLDVFVTQNMPDGVAVVMDRKRAVTLAIKKEIYTRIVKEGDFAVKGTVAVVGKLWTKAGRINDDAVCMITNAQNDATLD
jgi:hypothetical protein